MTKKTGSVLIVDDNEELLIAYRLFLEPHFEKIETLGNPNSVMSLLEKSQFDVILLDMNFSAGINSGNEGFFWMNKILEKDKDASIVFITAYGDIDLAIKAIKEGASDFILKSWDREKILSTILSSYKLRKSRIEIRNLRSKQQHLIDDANRNYEFYRGSSDKMRDIYKIIKKVSPTEANILILGENGTGKEIIAREIHNNSLRGNEMFISVDVASISETIFESELFGHVKGSFTDAATDRTGRIEIASGGTLFLDEIGNLPISLQAKLLTLIEKREITRVGSNVPVQVDVRLICATNSNLYQLCEEGYFREDLLYRINTIQLDLPPLRERTEDIPGLVDFFIKRFADKYGKPGMKIGRIALNQLSKQYWKGNIRELRNIIEKAVILSEGNELKPSDFVFVNGMRDNHGERANFNLDDNEKQIIERALKRFNNNIKLTAMKLGINRTTLYNKMRKHDIFKA